MTSQSEEQGIQQLRLTELTLSIAAHLNSITFEIQSLDNICVPACQAITLDMCYGVSRSANVIRQG
ncbi:hypothetical protein CCR75_000158 [Bremia lactucae]|uniref:Uncharacterized protein n=1 Tax=Bremia lactucae TaxID=4779 RepID=A0A976FNW6_BRELC|nr:hypothetical protein CCR75_000158 [Bremia lactucae]